jgi:hypothetical protein
MKLKITLSYVNKALNSRANMMVQEDGELRLLLSCYSTVPKLCFPPHGSR